MKKTIVISIVTALLLTVFSGCAQKELNVRFLDDYSDIPENLECLDWDVEPYIDPTVEQNVSFSVGNIEFSGTYRQTGKRCPEYYVYHEYQSEDGYFALTDNGKLVFFGRYGSSEEWHTSIRSEAECVDIACEFFSNLADVSQYVVTSIFNESREAYVVSFRRYVDGLKCDYAEIEVKKTGYISHMSSFNLGRIPMNAKPRFDLDAVKARVIELLDLLYSQKKQAYDDISYRFNYYLTIDEDGQYALQCSVEVDFINYDEDGAPSFVIPDGVITFLIQ